jgi:hypothetical protein
MTTPYESAQLILKLYELRREPLMRTARQWFVREFDPATIDDVKAVMATREKNPYLRMVVGYWDMACSLVVHGALDRQMFLDSAGELFGTFSKIQPLLAEIRQVFGPAFAKNIEAVLMAEPDIETRLDTVRKRLRAVAAALAAVPAAATSPA